jgi:hypothetical protein
MEERFFLNGIDIAGTRLPVDKRQIGALPVFPHSAVAALPIPKAALAGAEQAFHLTVREFFVISGFDCGEVGRLTEGVSLLQQAGQPRTGDHPGFARGL